MEKEKKKEKEGIISTKKVDESKEKRKPGALINVRVSALHSKGNKSELNRRYGVNHSSKRANGKVLRAIMIKSSAGINRCHVICECVAWPVKPLPSCHEFTMHIIDVFFCLAQVLE